MKIKGLIICLVLFTGTCIEVYPQTTVRERPAEWGSLVNGGRFMDLFLPMNKIGEMTSETWGTASVIPRDIKNGIESPKYSFWGGNIQLGADGKYHFFLCGWLEDSPRGHATWPNSNVFHAVSGNLPGPYVVADSIGKGHNPESFRLKDGRYVIYVINGYYVADNVNGPWTYGKFEFLNRDRRLIEGNSNFTFTQREDGSFLMICRGGGQWFSQTGLSSYSQVTGTRIDADNKIIPLRAYPAVEGRFEDPVVWRDNVQYNLIVNDWLGRIAFYERSKDGVNWIVEPGEAYVPGISKHEDGTVEEWFKYERLKMYQDKYGRAIQANFAVIDTLKNQDKSNDNHSSKNISIPLTVPRLLTILDGKKITAATKSIRVKISAEEDFSPQTDIDIKSLKFGAPTEVNYGRGCQVLSTEKSGNDLIVTFGGDGVGFPENEFAAKLLGKTSSGKLLFGWARLPWVNFIEPMLSARLPEIAPADNGFTLKVEVQNFGQVRSNPANLKIMYSKDEQEVNVAYGKIPGLASFQKTSVDLKCSNIFEKGVEYDMVVIINPGDKNAVELHGKITNTY
jgi:hypothetical protein